MNTAELSFESAKNALEAIEKIKDGVSNVQPSETVSMQPEITLSESKLRELWSKGILPDLAYTAFALEIERHEANFDVEKFARDWSIAAVELTEFDYENGWKPKKLKKRSILNAICILEEKNLATNQTNVQVQLSIFD